MVDKPCDEYVLQIFNGVKVKECAKYRIYKNVDLFQVVKMT